MVFSPGASSRGAGQHYPVSSPLRPSRGRILDNNGFPGPGATVADVALAAALRSGGIQVGDGFLPPPPAAGAPVAVPDEDSAANFLGSGAAYAADDDIGGNLSIAKLKRSIKMEDWFGVGTGDGADKVYKHSVTTKEFLRFTSGIELVTRPYMKHCYPGGTFMDFLLDPDYEPTLRNCWKILLSWSDGDVASFYRD